MLSTFSESARGAVLDVTRPPVLHSRRLGTGAVLAGGPDERVTWAWAIDAVTCRL